MYKLPVSLILLLSSLVSSLLISGAFAESIQATDDRIAVMGRIAKANDGSVRFSFPGVSFFANFEGKQLSIEAFSSSENSYLDVIIDNGTPKTVKLSTTPQVINLLSNSDSKNHSVEIIHRSETWHGVVTLKQFSSDGKFNATPQLPKRKIMVLGDSVTCAEAIERVEGAKKNTSWWNPRLSYGMLTAKNLNAQVQLVCMGGRGLIHSWNGKTDEHNLPGFYQDAIPELVPWNQTQYHPDVIVSAIGTNDFATGIPDREIYVSTYVKFVTQLLIDHKQAQILLIEGSILNGDSKTALTEYLTEVAKRVNDKRIHTASSTHYPGSFGDAHPDKAQHAAMANDLTEQIQKVIKW
jgi:lysophospholipase L1-like esterase